MYTQVNNQVSYGGILPILNNNVIKEVRRKQLSRLGLLPVRQSV